VVLNTPLVVIIVFVLERKLWSRSHCFS